MKLDLLLWKFLKFCYFSIIIILRIGNAAWWIIKKIFLSLSYAQMHCVNSFLVEIFRICCSCKILRLYHNAFQVCISCRIILSTCNYISNKINKNVQVTTWLCSQKFRYCSDQQSNLWRHNATSVQYAILTAYCDSILKKFK